VASETTNLWRTFWYISFCNDYPGSPFFLNVCIGSKIWYKPLQFLSRFSILVNTIEIIDKVCHFGIYHVTITVQAHHFGIYHVTITVQAHHFGIYHVTITVQAHYFGIYHLNEMSRFTIYLYTIALQWLFRFTILIYVMLQLLSRFIILVYTIAIFV
jgi:hypothetical protein